MKRRWKFLLCSAAALLFLSGYVAATGLPMVLYNPVAHVKVTIAPDELGRWKQRTRELAAERGGWFRDKHLDGHVGSIDPPLRYTFRQFGYCNLSECVVLSNNFRPDEYRLTVYASILGGEGIELREELEEMGIEVR